MTNLKELTPKELEAYATGILKNARGKIKSKRDSRPVVGFGGKRRRLSSRKKHNN